MRASWIVVLMVVMLGACGPATPDQILVGSWQRISEESFDGNEFSASDSCRQDDVMDYTADGGWQRFQGATLCEGSDNFTVASGGWTLKGDGTILVETEVGFVGEYEAVVEELNEERFVRTHATGLTSAPLSLRWTHVRVTGE